MKTITGQFEWNAAAQVWEVRGRRREADGLVLAELAPDEQGISGWLRIVDLLARLPDRYRGRIVGNGSNMFNRGRGLAKDFIFEKQKRGRILAVRMIGLVPQIERSQAIRSDIARAIRRMPCVLTGTHQDVEPDHKVGRKNERRLEDLSQQQLTDFQPLNATNNKIKRAHCQRCERTGRRFDARSLEYSVGWWVGGEMYQSCNGCFWHDIARFRREVSGGAGEPAVGLDGSRRTKNLDQGSLLESIDE